VSTPATPATPATLATLAAPVADHAMGVEEAAAPLESFTDIVTNNMLEMISVHDFSPEGAYIYVSPTCRTLLGYAPEDMVGKPAHYFFHPDDLTDLKSIHDDVLGAKEHDPAAYRIGDQLRLRKADGSYLWTVTSTKSTPRGFVCVTRDDTYFHKLQCALRDNLRKYEMLLALSPDMVTLHAASDTLMPITYASKASESILGWSPNELVGRSHYDLCHWADVAAVQERHDKILEEHRAGIGGSTVTSFHTCRMRRKDGSYAFVEVSSMWSFVPPGTVVKITRDVTERKALEAERALALERHELLARHTADIISLHAPSEHFEFLYMSPSVRIMLGYREA
jgi:PAS domain S-box-containing protein